MVEERPGSWGLGSWTEEAGAMKGEERQVGHQRVGRALKGDRGLQGADAGARWESQATD